MVLNVVIMSNHLDASSGNGIHEELLRGLPGISDCRCMEQS